MSRKRLSTGERKELILAAATKLVKEHGVHSLKHEEVAARCTIETSVATVRRYFGSWDDLANAVAGHPACPIEFKEYMDRLK